MGSAVDSALSATSSAASKATDIDFIDELKNGLAVLLHVKAGKLEPASLQLDEETGKLVLKTNREGWCAFCHCYSRHYEFGPDELEPMPLRMHTRQLTRSVSIVNGGDSHLMKNMLQRSLSLLRRFPRSEAIDLTFPTAEMEESLRVWAHNTLCVKPTAILRQSSQEITNALAGRSPSEWSDQESAGSEDPSQREQQQQEAREERDLPPVLPRSASVHPAQQQTRQERRHSLNPFRQQSQLMTNRRKSTGSDRLPGGGGGGGGGVKTSSVGGDRGEGGGGGAMGKGLEDDSSSENTSWAWKEPPILRRMETSRTAGRSRSRSRRASSAAGPPGGSYPTEETPQLGRVASMSGMDGQGKQWPLDVDFWDPLGLMSNATPQTPLTARSVESGNQRWNPWDTPKISPTDTPRSAPTQTRGRAGKPKDRRTE